LTALSRPQTGLSSLDVIHTIFKLGQDDIHSRDGVGVVRNAVPYVSHFHYRSRLTSNWPVVKQSRW